MEKMDPRILFGRRLAQLRKQKGWSQEKLALESGITRCYLGGVERGQRDIALINTGKLAATLEVPVGELFDFKAAEERMCRTDCPCAIIEPTLQIEAERISHPQHRSASQAIQFGDQVFRTQVRIALEHLHGFVAANG